MSRSAKEIAYTGVTVALLIGGQMVLSAVSGVEIVTAIFALYCFVFGVMRGVIVASAFSIVRCFAFGFYPQVILLYLIYYNLFAVAVGFLGRQIKDKKIIVQIIFLTLLAGVLTCCFTLLDNALNIYLFNIPKSAWGVYIGASIPVLIRQVICAVVTVPAFFYPLQKVFKRAIMSL